jgi:hypothetical protein
VLKVFKVDPRDSGVFFLQPNHFCRVKTAMKIENEEQCDKATNRYWELYHKSKTNQHGMAADILEMREIEVAISDYVHSQPVTPTREEIYQQALDEAIMGLHGMNREYPNPLNKTRQEYLDGVIAGINDTLSLLK